MTQPKVMLLIDADNVSIDVIEQTVLHLLAEYGALHGRRAYCNPESAIKHQAIFKRLGIRPMVNLAAGKNSTDIALAVDTMELVMRERPDVLAIASSDSDFAPLVTRVREKGCRVLGFGQDGKTGESTVALYDRYVQFSARGQLVEPGDTKPARRATARRAAGVKTSSATTSATTSTSSATSSATTRRTAAPKLKAAEAAPASPAPAAAEAPPAPRRTAKPAKAEPTPAAKKSPPKRTSAAAGAAKGGPQGSAMDEVMAALLAEDVEAAMGGGMAEPVPQLPPPLQPQSPSQSTPRRPPAPATQPKRTAAPAPNAKPPSAPPPAPARSDEVQRLVAAAPELSQGQAVDLNRVAEALRKLGLLSKNASSIRWLARFPDAFELTPPAKPNKVRLRP